MRSSSTLTYSEEFKKKENLKTKRWVPLEFKALQKFIKKAKRPSETKKPVDPQKVEKLFQAIITSVKNHLTEQPLEVACFIDRFKDWDEAHNPVKLNKKYTEKLNGILNKALLYVTDTFKKHEAKLFGRLEFDCLAQAHQYNEKLLGLKQNLVSRLQSKLKKLQCSKEEIDALDEWSTHIKGAGATIRKFKRQAKDLVEKQEIKEIIKESKREAQLQQTVSENIKTTAEALRKMKRLCSNFALFVESFILEKPRESWRRIKIVVLLAQHAFKTKNFLFGRALLTGLLEGNTGKKDIPSVWLRLKERASIEIAIQELEILANPRNHHEALVKHMLAAVNDTRYLIVPDPASLFSKFNNLTYRVKDNQSNYLFETFKYQAIEKAMTDPREFEECIQREKRPDEKDYLISLQAALLSAHENRDELFKQWQTEREKIKLALDKKEAAEEEAVQKEQREIAKFIKRCIKNSKKITVGKTPSHFFSKILSWHEHELSYADCKRLVKRAESINKKIVAENSRRKKDKRKSCSEKITYNPLPQLSRRASIQTLGSPHKTRERKNTYL